MRLLIVLLLISTTITCKDIAELADKDMPSIIEKVINSNQTDSFLIDSIAKFEWDELFILKPYLSESQYGEVEKKVDNMPWMAPYTFSADWHIYFVFAKNGKAVKFSQ